jgi:hypothetical protein
MCEVGPGLQRKAMTTILTPFVNVKGGVVGSFPPNSGSLELG